MAILANIWPLIARFRSKESEETIPDVPSPFVGPSEQLIGEIWQSGHPIKKRNGDYELHDGDRVTTNKFFETPVAFRLIAKTNSINLRFSYLVEEIIFNWEAKPDDLRLALGGPIPDKTVLGRGRIPINEWVVIDVVAERNSYAIYVNGGQRCFEPVDLSKSKGPFAIFQKFGSVIHVKSLEVGQLSRCTDFTNPRKACYSQQYAKEVPQISPRQTRQRD